MTPGLVGKAYRVGPLWPDLAGQPEAERDGLGSMLARLRGWDMIRLEIGEHGCACVPCRSRAEEPFAAARLFGEL
ncbi:hypothetical protein HNR42_001971 [Deinobacterium chartae]|uniref:Uncharacterized protein n=1 Tax=Deinobacterium chartae TaxID=521158 RepID=A0A841HYR8_9DEIO|nr:hypothetical protein [Deinobacterium chartae]MBB6098537.1 hypothetical protein [Deinobacterium chartae]